jgi:RecJ-like exonuclease
MSIEYDEKGKYYTNVIQKVPVPAMVQTTNNLIRGLIHVRQDERLKDELEGNEQFIAVTDVSVCDASGKVIFSGPFIAVQKDQIVWVMPLSEEHKGEAGQ